MSKNIFLLLTLLAPFSSIQCAQRDDAESVEARPVLKQYSITLPVLTTLISVGTLLFLNRPDSTTEKLLKAGACLGMLRVVAVMQKNHENLIDACAQVDKLTGEVINALAVNAGSCNDALRALTARVNRAEVSLGLNADTLEQHNTRITALATRMERADALLADHAV